MMREMRRNNNNSSRKTTNSRRNRRSAATTTALLLAVAVCSNTDTTDAFCPSSSSSTNRRLDLQPLFAKDELLERASKFLSSVAATAALSTALVIGAPTGAFAENELSDKYGGKGFDSSLVDQTCLVDKCSLQAKACLADDPDCRKGLTCTAKCLGDNACITGCMARYGDENLDNLLKCTIEDNECIKVAILDGGADKFGEEPRPPAPTVRSFNLNSMDGAWYKVVGFNPNYDCYACQKNTFSIPQQSSSLFTPNDKLELDVQFSMPRMLPDGTPPPPSNVRETIQQREEDGLMVGSKSIGFNDYQTHEVMVFDNPRTIKSQVSDLVLGKGTEKEVSYSRTAHSEGEMFGLKFWENWYIIGENEPGQPEFKFVYYNGKTRQNTYDGAFVYSRTKELGPEAMQQVYKIASDAGMNPDQFCKIRNGCFKDDPSTLGTPSDPFRGIMASTKISQLLGVEPVAAEGVLKNTQLATAKLSQEFEPLQRHWWHEVGDYLEDPSRHFNIMDSLRITMDWPAEVKQQK